MGATVSAGADNDELVDNLLEADYIKTPAVERVFRAVDRGHYFTVESRENAYKDLAWKYGNIHISAPCIYSEVMENLKLARGMSFLNLGSGTGYLSTMAGLILGANGINHGVEIHEDVLEYAGNKLEEFFMNSPAIDEYEFCQPKFVSGNCLNLSADTRQYDRVYCGAACPENQEHYMKSLIKVGGILVMPINNQLLQIYRVSEDLWETRTVLPVSFASLVPNSDESVIEPVKLPDADPLSLQDICRFTIRAILRQQINKEHPELKSDTLQESRMRIKKRTLRKFVIPIFGNNADNQGDITPEDINGLRDFGRRGFLMDVQSVRSCRTLLELLPGPSSRTLLSGDEGDVEAEYEDYEDLDDYENLQEQTGELEIYENHEVIDDNDENTENVINVESFHNAVEAIHADHGENGVYIENTEMDIIDISEDNDINVANEDNDEDDEDNEDDVQIDVDVDDDDEHANNDEENNEEGVNDNVEGGPQENEMDDVETAFEGFDNAQENEMDDVETAFQNLDNPPEERGTDDLELMETDMEIMTRSKARKTARSSTPYSSKMVTRSSAKNANTSPTDSTGNSSRMTTRSTARKIAKNATGSSNMITRSAAKRRASPRATSRMNTRMSSRMSSMMGSVMRNRMRNRPALRVGNRAGTRMGTRMAARPGSRLRRSSEQNDSSNDILDSQFLHEIPGSEVTSATPHSLENLDPDDKILVRFENSDTESLLDDTPEKQEEEEEEIANYSTYMREKIKLLPLPTSLKYFLNYNRDL